VLETWKKAFPGIIQPQSAIPQDVVAHLRYPEDLFRVQRSLLTKYHITDAHAFYTGTDYWKVPDDPTKTGDVAQPPYYLTLALPGQTTPSFQLTTTLQQNQRQNMAAFVSVASDPSSPDYGKLEVLELPSSAQVPGPGQVHNDFRSFPKASNEISLLDQHGSQVDEGNLLTLPLANGFVYVEPLYVKSAGTTSFPTLKRVLVQWNGTTAYEASLGQALDVAFGAQGTAPTPTGPATGPVVSTTIAQLISQLQAAQADAEKALEAKDLAAYATAEKRIAQLIAELGRSAQASPSPSPSPSSH
jgi:uncharacterized protein